MSEQVQRQALPINSGKRRVIFVVLAVLVVGVFVFWLKGRGWVATDDAQIQGDLVPISARVNGFVSKIDVKDNQVVNAGQILVQLDSKDLHAKLQKVQADLANQTALETAAANQVGIVSKTSRAGELQAGASVSGAEAGIDAVRSQIASAQAQVSSAQANAQVANDGISSARSDVDSVNAQIEAARAALQVAKADADSAEAQAHKTAEDAARYEQLFASGAASKQQLDAMQAANTSAQSAFKAAQERISSANSSLKQAQTRKASAAAGLKQAVSRAASARAMVRRAAAGLNAAKTALSEAEARLAGARAGESAALTSPQQIAMSEAQRKATLAKISSALADIRTSRLQLSYTRIAAPVAGVVSQKSVQLGQYVQPGQLLMAVVRLSDSWVVANFKETEVGHMRVGQRALVVVDTYHGRKFPGHVDSIGAATGSKFSLLPAENATGNFVKVVQRIPVKIVLDGPLPKGIVLRPGTNVMARVRTGD
jgi:membrane fusion protein, multidrug efflux system